MSDDSRAKNNKEQIRFNKISKITWQYLKSLQNIQLQQRQPLQIQRVIWKKSKACFTRDKKEEAFVRNREEELQADLDYWVRKYN